jgi:hypothetical protein
VHIIIDYILSEKAKSFNEGKMQGMRLLRQVKQEGRVEVTDKLWKQFEKCKYKIPTHHDCDDCLPICNRDLETILDSIIAEQPKGANQ